MNRNEAAFNNCWQAYHGMDGIIRCLNVGNDAPFRNILDDADRYLSPWAAETLAKVIRDEAQCRVVVEIFAQFLGDV